MKELEFLELQEISMQEIISFSKLNTSPTITILDDLNYNLFNQVCVWADCLKLVFFIIKDTHKIAIIGNSQIALKMAKVMQIKSQVIFNAPLKQKKILGKLYTSKRGSTYIVKAFDGTGKPIAPFIDTETTATDCNILSKYHFAPFKYAMKIRRSRKQQIRKY